MAEIFERLNAGDFCDLARGLALHKQISRLSIAIGLKNFHTSERVRSVVYKASVAGGSVSDSGWAGALTDYRTISDGFLESLRSICALDAMLPSMRRLPPHIAVAVVTQGASGHLISEAQWKPLTRLSVAASDVPPYKAVSILVTTAELLRLGTPGTLTLFANELRGAVALATDSPVMTALLAGITPAASSGDARTDVETLLSSITLRTSSRPMWLTTPSVVAQMAGKHGESGPVFPDLNATGGFIAGVPVAACDSLIDFGGNGDHLLLADCSQLGGETDVVTVDSSTQTDIAMSDAPSDGAQSMTSMFATDGVAIRVERQFAFARLRQSAVVALKEVSYSAGSP